MHRSNNPLLKPNMFVVKKDRWHSSRINKLNLVKSQL